MSTRLSNDAVATIDTSVRMLLRRLIRSRTPLEALMGEGFTHQAALRALPRPVRDAMVEIDSHDAHAGRELWEQRDWAQVPVKTSDGRVYALYLKGDSSFYGFTHKSYVPIQQLNVDEGRLVQWLDHEDFVNRSVAGVLLTLHELLNMCTTVGQIVRIAPDLEKYIPAHKLASFAKQSTKSPFPREYAGYTRAWVREMQNTLAHCYLLSDNGSYLHPQDLQPPYFDCTSALRINWGRKPLEELQNHGAMHNLWWPPSRYVSGERAPLGHLEVRFGHESI